MSKVLDNIELFLKESLEIESIFREPTVEEYLATVHFIKLDKPTITDLQDLVKVYQPDAVLRTTASHRVWIGGREAPVGGNALLHHLDNVLSKSSGPVHTHQHYEYLHPFTDGNGRSGRALWANLMYKQGYDFSYKFLQMYYYQTLSEYASNQ